MGVTYDPVTLDSICSRLRRLVQESFQKHLYPTACFYADKLVCLSRDAEDLYTLAECYFKNREYRRVLHLLKKQGDVVSKDERLKLLAVQSLMECRDWDECLRYLEDNTSADSKAESVFALLRGKVYEVTENQENALLWYEKAIQLDPYCYEALDRLVGNHMLTVDKEVALLGSLQLHQEDEWLRHLYAAKLAATGSSQASKVDQLMMPAAAASNAATSGAAAVEAMPPAGVGPSPFAENVAADAFEPMMQHQAPSSSSRQRRFSQAMNDEDLAVDKYPNPYIPVALVMNGHTLAAQATRYFYEGDYKSSYEVSKRVLEGDPYHMAVLPVHIASLVMLDMKSALFYVAHQLVNAYPSTAVAWFTAGCYYTMVKKYEHARRFFHKALALDHNFAPAWIAYGHAFANHDESDQALAAYRTASRLFPGSHLPWLFIGMEYVRTNSLQLASQCLECARTFAPSDPHVYNEIAVVAFHRKDYGRACDILLDALRLPGAALKDKEAILSNLGHAFLKCKAFDRALEAFQQAHRLNARSAPILAGVAFAMHLLGSLDEAIKYYHRSLSIQRDDAFTTDMLNYAVQEVAERPVAMDL